MSAESFSSASPSAPDRGEATDVAALHAAIGRERPDPVEGREPLNLWLVVFIAALLFWAGAYLTHYSGGFRADEFNELQINPPPPPAPKGGAGGGEDPLIKQGAVVYTTYCAPCHQADGNGVAGQFPPLAGSEWVLGEGPNRIIRIVLHGLQGPIEVKGQAYNNAMNAFRDSLSDAEIAAAISYIRNSWGNKASVVKPDEVVALRGATADRSAPWSAAELLEIPESGGAAPAAGAPASLGPDQIKAALEALSAEERKALLEALAP